MVLWAERGWSFKVWMGWKVMEGRGQRMGRVNVNGDRETMSDSEEERRETKMTISAGATLSHQSLHSVPFFLLDLASALLYSIVVYVIAVSLQSKDSACKETSRVWVVVGVGVRVC